MRIDSNKPNTLILSILAKGQAAALLGNLRGVNGMIPDVVTLAGDSPWSVLYEAIEDARIIAPSQVIIYSNEKRLVDTYSFPLRIPLPTPQNLAQFYRERAGKYREGMWVIPDSVAVDADTMQYQIFRQLCRFDRWQFVWVPIEKMKKTEELWNTHFSNKKYS